MTIKTNLQAIIHTHWTNNATTIVMIFVAVPLRKSQLIFKLLLTI